MKYQLPKKIDAYLATLNRLYERDGESLSQAIVVNSIVSIHEKWDYDNWDGGIYGHAVTLTVPEEIFLDAIDRKDELQTRIAQDLNALNNIQNEHISCVFIEMTAIEADRWREESGVYRLPQNVSPITDDSINRIWGDFPVRVFLSHKANIKVETSQLKESLSRFGISGFVAHEDIEPTQEWLREIERALFSMDALVALLTPDFHDSLWTDQEVGIAMGRSVPVIPIRLGLDPYGLMGKGQGLSGYDLSSPHKIAPKIFELLHKRLPDKSKLIDAAIRAYSESLSFEDSKVRVQALSRFENLSSAQVDRVLMAFRGNKQNQYSWDGREALRALLVQWTGQAWMIRDDDLTIEEPPRSSVYEPIGEDDIPF